MLLCICGCDVGAAHVVWRRSGVLEHALCRRTRLRARRTDRRPLVPVPRRSLARQTNRAASGPHHRADDGRSGRRRHETVPPCLARPRPGRHGQCCTRALCLSFFFFFFLLTLSHYCRFGTLQHRSTRIHASKSRAPPSAHSCHSTSSSLACWWTTTCLNRVVTVSMACTMAPVRCEVFFFLLFFVRV